MVASPLRGQHNAGRQESVAVRVAHSAVPSPLGLGVRCGGFPFPFLARLDPGRVAAGAAVAASVLGAAGGLLLGLGNRVPPAARGVRGVFRFNWWFY